MIKLGDITDSTLKIKDLVKSSNNKKNGIIFKTDDFKVLHQFESIFCIDSFRKSARNYRNLNGRENLNEELTLILKAISYFFNFYEANKLILDQINKDDLITTEVEYYDKEVRLANKEIVKLNKRISDLSTQINTKELSLDCENLEYDNLILKKTALIGELITLKLEKHERSANHKKYTSLYTKTSSFSKISESYSILKRLIEYEFLMPKNLFSNKITKESLHIINQIFEPKLDFESANKLFNKTYNSGLFIKFRKNEKMRACRFIYFLSELIDNKELRLIWINDALSYFCIEKGLYDRKKKHTNNKEFEDDLKHIVPEFE